MNKLILKFQGILTIVLLSIILGITINFVSPNGISLLYSYNTHIDISDDLFISIEEIKQFYEKTNAIFLDSRSYSSYKKGHIENSISLPYFEFNKYYPKFSDKTNKNSFIIIYCGGESCNSSDKLAIKLMDKGYNNIRIFKNGWNQWKSAKLPIKKIQ